MRCRWFAVLFFAGVLVARAEKPFPEAEVPAEDLVVAEVETVALPAQLVERLRAEEAFQSGEDGFPLSLRVIRADLDGDGHDDYFVEEPASYTGGSIYWIFSSEEEGCRPLGQVQGWFYLAPAVKGWAQIVADARAGGGEFVRKLFVFRDGEYRVQRAATYRESDGGEVFLREGES